MHINKHINNLSIIPLLFYSIISSIYGIVKDNNL